MEQVQNIILHIIKTTQLVDDDREEDLLVGDGMAMEWMWEFWYQNKKIRLHFFSKHIHIEIVYYIQ